MVGGLLWTDRSSGGARRLTAPARRYHRAIWELRENQPDGPLPWWRIAQRLDVSIPRLERFVLPPNGSSLLTRIPARAGSPGGRHRSSRDTSRRPDCSVPPIKGAARKAVAGGPHLPLVLRGRRASLRTRTRLVTACKHNRQQRVARADYPRVPRSSCATLTTSMPNRPKTSSTS
jgi:hypothetical protein